MSLKGSYVWVVEDTVSFLNTSIGETVVSDVFEMCSLKWYIKAYPNGQSEKKKGLCGLYLTMINSPFNKCDKIYADRCFKCINTDTVYTWCEYVENDKPMGWVAKNLPIDQLRKSVALTNDPIRFSFKVSILTAIDKDNNEIDLHTVFMNHEENKNNDQQSAVKKESDVSSMDVRIKSISSWLDSMNDRFDKMEKRMSDFEENKIQNNNKSDFSSMDVRIQSISSVLDSMNGRISKMEESKMQSNDMMSEFESLKQSMNLLLNVNSKKEPKKSKIGQWLKNVVGKEEYIDLFIDNEIDFDVLIDMNDNDLQSIGISKFGDRKRILKAIIQLKNKQIRNDNEGNDSNYL